MDTPGLGQLQRILVSATRCLDCNDARCMNLCPEHVDVRAAMQFIIDRTNVRRTTWTQQTDEATQSAMNAIEASFEPSE